MQKMAIERRSGKVKLPEKPSFGDMRKYWELITTSPPEKSGSASRLLSPKLTPVELDASNFQRERVREFSNV